MGKKNVTTAQFEEMVELINYIYQSQAEARPKSLDQLQKQRNRFIRQLHSVYKPSARPYAGRVVANIAIAIMDDALIFSDRIIKLQRQLAEEQEASAGHAPHLVRENRALQDEIQRLKKIIAQQPSTRTEVVIPEKVITFRSRIKREALRLMGEEGLGRSWQIINRVAATGVGVETSIRNALRQMTEDGLIKDYLESGEIAKWKYYEGGNRRLLMLAHDGKMWYQGQYGEEAKESELVAVERRHGLTHGIGILEARDYLRSAGYLVDDTPAPILADPEKRWGTRVEPDLAVTIDGQEWPVEVQREVAMRQIDKWSKALELAGRLVIILFSESKFDKQLLLLKRAIRERELPTGSILLTCLEEMMTGSWEWTQLNSSIHS